VYRKVKNVLSGISNRGEHRHGANDISTVEGQYKIWCLQWIRRAMFMADIHILNFCVGFSTGRYIYFWNLLQKTGSTDKGEIWPKA
jgi:hypothetical protein